MPSAIWLRQELPVQRMRTVGFLSLQLDGLLSIDLDPFAHSNLSGRSFEAQSVELAKGQGGQQLQTALDLLRHQPECARARLRRTLRRRGIRRAPMREDRLPRPRGTGLPRVVTKGHDEIERGVCELSPR